MQSFSAWLKGEPDFLGVPEWRRGKHTHVGHLVSCCQTNSWRTACQNQTKPMALKEPEGGFELCVNDESSHKCPSYLPSFWVGQVNLLSVPCIEICLCVASSAWTGCGTRGSIRLKLAPVDRWVERGTQGSVLGIRGLRGQAGSRQNNALHFSSYTGLYYFKCPC